MKFFTIMKLGFFILALVLLTLTSLSALADLPNTVIEPLNPSDSDDLFCYVDVPETIPFAVYTWYKNGVEITNGVSTRSDGSHLDDSQTRSGDRIRCEAVIVYGPSLPSIPTNPSQVTVLADEPTLNAVINTDRTTVSIGEEITFDGFEST